MRRIRGWTGLRASVVAFGLVAAAAGPAQAAPMITYNTIGSSVGLDPSGVMGPISYVPISGASFLAPSALSLGAFQVNALPAGQSDTFNNLPFTIKFTASPTAGDMSPATGNPFMITGHLSGTVTGSGQSSVTATFDPAPSSPASPGASAAETSDPGYQFMTGLYANTLKVADNPLILVPSSTNSGMSTVQANLTASTYTAPVPEPSTVLLFAATVAGLGLRRHIRRARLAD